MKKAQVLTGELMESPVGYQAPNLDREGLARHPQKLGPGAPDLWCVDDFAMREHTPTQSDDRYDLLADRASAAQPLVLTSNRAPKDWYPLFPNPSSPSRRSTG